jgi:glucose-6-phosphate dehydrogenase assembly protein OpcA
MIRLEKTSGGAVASAIQEERHRLGAPTSGMVLTLLIMADEETQADATDGALTAARQHPMRILTLIGRPDSRTTQLDAEIRVGGDDGPGEVALLRLRNELANYPNSVAVPLLLPDTPVVAYWPGESPEVPSDSLIGRHAQRRITDASFDEDPYQALRVRQQGYHPGDTDLAWARCTQWRSVIAAIFDAPMSRVHHIRVAGERNNPSVILMGAWLGQMFATTFEIIWDDTIAISGVELDMDDGLLRVTRIDDKEANIQRPGYPDQRVSLPRRPTSALLAEELRRLDPDDMYGQVIAGLLL